MVNLKITSRKRRYVPSRSVVRVRRIAVRRAWPVRKEIHYLDSTVSEVPPAGGDVLCLNQVGVGSSYVNRTGMAITSRYIQINWVVFPPSTATNYDTISFALVYDKQTNGAAVAYTDIFDTHTAVAPVGGLEFKNVSYNGDRFTIVRRWFSDVTSGNGSTCGSRGSVFFKVPPKMMESRFAGTAAAVPNTGGWLLAFRSERDTANGATSANTLVSWRYAFNER